jgi:hypothetical protein
MSRSPKHDIHYPLAATSNSKQPSLPHSAHVIRTRLHPHFPTQPPELHWNSKRKATPHVHGERVQKIVLDVCFKVYAYNS